MTMSLPQMTYRERQPAEVLTVEVSSHLVLAALVALPVDTETLLHSSYLKIFSI